MSDVPPEPPREPPPPTPPIPPTPPSGYGGIGRTPTVGAILPVPGNAELALYVVVVIFLVILWAASDLVDARYFALLLTVLTSFYFVSRGIAKASRVLEQ